MLAPGGQATINIQFSEKERLKWRHVAIAFLSGKEPIRSEGMRIAPANAPRTLRRQWSRLKTIQTD